MANKYHTHTEIILGADVLEDGQPFLGSGEFVVNPPRTPVNVVIPAVHLGAGKHECNYVIGVAGRHYYRFRKTDGTESAQEKWFDVYPERAGT